VAFCTRCNGAIVASGRPANTWPSCSSPISTLSVPERDDSRLRCRHVVSDKSTTQPLWLLTFRCPMYTEITDSWIMEVPREQSKHSFARLDFDATSVKSDKARSFDTVHSPCGLWIFKRGNFVKRQFYSKMLKNWTFDNGIMERLSVIIMTRVTSFKNSLAFGPLYSVQYTEKNTTPLMAVFLSKMILLWSARRTDRMIFRR